MFASATTEALVALTLWTACGSACGDPEHSSSAAAAEPATGATAEAPESLEPQQPSQAVRVDPCPALEAEARATLAEVDASFATHGEADPEHQRHWTETSAPLRQCIDAGRGAWMLLPSSAAATWRRGAGPWDVEERVMPELGVSWRLTYVAPDGTRLSAPVSEVRFDPFEAKSQRVELLDARDLDGNGVAELVLALRSSHMESGQSAYSFWSVVEGAIAPYPPAAGIPIVRLVEGAIAPYPPAAGIPIVRLVDADEDGRLDILSVERFWHRDADCGGMDGEVIGLPPVLFHSRTDGSFSASDEVAIHFLRQECPAAPVAFIDRSVPCWVDEALKRVGCARLWGRSAADVVAAFRDELAAAPAPPLSLEEVQTLAHIDPPTTLR